MLVSTNRRLLRLKLFYFIGSFLLFNTTQSSQVFALSQAEFSAEAAAIMRPYGNRAGLSIRDSRGKLLVGTNGAKAFVPASVSKLVSSACALDELGPHYSMTTGVYRRGSVVGGVLKGDLVFRGGGDFSFVIEHLKMIVERLIKIHGIRKIEGSLIFQTEMFKESRMRIMKGFDNDRGRAFNALLTPLPINHNAFSIWIRPDGEKGAISIFPDAATALKVSNKTKVVSGRLGGSRLRLNYLPEYDRIEFAGQVGRGDLPKAYYRALKDPYESFARLFKSNFRAQGGVWDGNVKLESKFLESDKYIFEHQSRAVSRLLFDINKLSTNFGSEMLNLQAAHHLFKKPVGREEGAAFLSSCVEEFGYSEAQMVLANASGLSRGSKIQPNALSSFLIDVLGKDYSAEYLSSLSVLGRDGTTRKRLQKFEGQARLKTGTIRSVNTIAGYVGRDVRSLFSFVMLLNCESCSMRDWERAENKIISLVLQYQKQLEANGSKP